MACLSVRVLDRGVEIMVKCDYGLYVIELSENAIFSDFDIIFLLLAQVYWQANR